MHIQWRCTMQNKMIKIYNGSKCTKTIYNIILLISYTVKAKASIYKLKIVKNNLQNTVTLIDF